MLFAIIMSVVIITVLAFLIGLLQSATQHDRALATEVRREKILDCLPGDNCGACGYTDCAALAYAIACGKAPLTSCPAGGASALQQISVIMGVEAKEKPRMRAQVMCSGTEDTTRKKYIYDSGVEDCLAAMRLGGGEKSCKYACVGMGSCAKSCPFDAVSIIDGTAVVDYKKCTGCGICVSACPKGIIRLIPYDSYHWVGCVSREREARSKYNCGVGCTGCGECVRVCEAAAISVKDHVAEIDYDVCNGCGSCYEVCPTGVIWRADTEGADGLVFSRRR